jgi:hypothetical protein
LLSGIYTWQAPPRRELRDATELRIRQRIAVRSANNPATAPTVFFPAASLSTIQLVTIEMRDASGLNQAFDALIRAKVQALISEIRRGKR